MRGQRHSARKLWLCQHGFNDNIQRFSKSELDDISAVILSVIFFWIFLRHCVAIFNVILLFPVRIYYIGLYILTASSNQMKTYTAKPISSVQYSIM